MQCPHCSKEIRDIYKICPYCKNIVDSPLGTKEVPAKTCHICGTVIPVNSLFCMKCGANVLQGSTEQQLQSPPIRHNPSPRSPPQGGVSTGVHVIKFAVKGVIVLVFGLILLGIIFGSGSSTPATTASSSGLTVNQLKSTAIVVPYDDLFRNNEQYIGKIVKIQGKIIQSQNSGSDYVFRVSTKPEYYYEDLIYLNYNGPRFIEGDIVDIWGKVDGLKTYTAVLGNSVTIPEITSNHLELVPQTK